MPVRTDQRGISRSHTQQRNSADGSRQTKRDRGLVTPQMRQRCTIIPRIHRILPILRAKLLENSTTTDTTDSEEHPLPLVGTPHEGIRNTQNPHVPPTNSATTRLQQMFLPGHRCLFLRCGSRTLTRGRNQPSNPQNHAPSYSILLCHVHTHRTKLRHLRKRTPSAHESPTSLETTHSSYRNSSNSAHRPR